TLPPQKILDDGAELLEIFHFSKSAVSGHGDFATLFGHHQAQNIDQLRQPEGRRVAGADIGKFPEVLGKREMSGEKGDMGFVDHDRAVVPWRMRIKKAF